MPVRYHISLPHPDRARGNDPALSFHAQGADGFAEELESALQSPGLFERWRGNQPEPDEVDASLGATDPGASVSGEQDHLRIRLTAVTSIPGHVLKHRLNLLAGSAWELRDVSAA